VTTAAPLIPRSIARRPFSALVLGALVALGAASAHSEPQGRQAISADDMRAWLMRIHDAAAHRNFQGTFVVSGGGAVSSARISHFVVGANQYERSESLDGQARYVFRYNDRVHTVWPVARVAVIEERTSIASFPALLQDGDDRIVEFYDVHPESSERVAGHEANVLLVKPKDALRYGYRLWADRATGLLLRADVLGERGEVLETAAFSDVAINIRPQPESVLQPMKRLDGYRLLRPAMHATRLDTEGWKMRELVAGFRLVSCVKRPIQGALAVDREGAGTQVLQAIFADGLTYVSVFIEPHDGRQRRRAAQAAMGATQTLVQQQGNWWVTVVGDAPPATLREFAKNLEPLAK
jgi:sigma-E factor negative regulatory protein RseB